MLENYPIQGKLEAIKLEQHLPPQHLIPKNHAAVQHIFLKKKERECRCNSIIGNLTSRTIQGPN